MAMGIVLAMCAFAITYAQAPTVSATLLRNSTVVRTYEERAILIRNRGRLVTIKLGGYIFFGSAVKLLEEVKKHVVISTDQHINIDGKLDSSIGSQ
jgi:MFS superfamily sulfate permease-like transporter